MIAEPAAGDATLPSDEGEILATAGSQGAASDAPGSPTAPAATVVPMTTDAMVTAPPVHHRPWGSIAVEEEGGVAVLRLSGEIDQAAVAAYDRAHADVGTAPAVIDVSGVTFLDCRGLRFLVRESAAARRAGRRPALRRPPRVVRRVLCATGADELFTITA